MFQLGHGELAFAPEAALRRLCDWLGLPFEPAMLQPGLHSGSHIVSGNCLRFEPGQSHAIRYDAAWLAFTTLSLRVSPMITLVAAINRRLV